MDYKDFILFMKFINFVGADTVSTRSLRRCVKKEKCTVTDQYMLNNKYANVQTKGQNVYLHYSTDCFRVYSTYSANFQN